MPTDVVKLGERQIGRNLQQHGRRTCLPRHALARIDDPRQQVVERAGLLQIAQPRRVRRGNVDGDIARHRREPLDQPHIIGDAVGRVFVGPDIDADNAAGIGPRREPAQHGLGALRVEAEPVDHPLIGVKAEDPRPRVAPLRQRRDGAGFDKAEAQAQQRIRHLGILVEPRRHADRIGKIQPEGAHRQAFVVAGGARKRRACQHLDSEAMRVFRIERVEEWPRQTLEQADHAGSSGSARRPSTASGSGCVQRTALSGSGA